MQLFTSVLCNRLEWTTFLKRGFIALLGAESKFIPRLEEGVILMLICEMREASMHSSRRSYVVVITRSKTVFPKLNLMTANEVPNRSVSIIVEVQQSLYGIDLIVFSVSSFEGWYSWLFWCVFFLMCPASSSPLSREPKAYRETRHSCGYLFFLVVVVFCFRLSAFGQHQVSGFTREETVLEERGCARRANWHLKSEKSHYP